MGCSEDSDIEGDSGKRGCALVKSCFAVERRKARLIWINTIEPLSRYSWCQPPPLQVGVLMLMPNELYWFSDTRANTPFVSNESSFVLSVLSIVLDWMLSRLENYNSGHQQCNRFSRFQLPTRVICIERVNIDNA